MYFCRSSKQLQTICSLLPADPSFLGSPPSLIHRDPPKPFLTDYFRVFSSLRSRKAMDLPRQSQALFSKISPALNYFTASWQFPSRVSMTPLAHNHRQEQSSAALRLRQRQSLLSWILPSRKQTRERKQRARELVNRTGQNSSMSSSTVHRIELQTGLELFDGSSWCLPPSPFNVAQLCSGLAL